MSRGLTAPQSSGNFCLPRNFVTFSFLFFVFQVLIFSIVTKLPVRIAYAKREFTTYTHKNFQYVLKPRGGWIYNKSSRANSNMKAGWFQMANEQNTKCLCKFYGQQNLNNASNSDHRNSSASRASIRKGT